MTSAITTSMVTSAAVTGQAFFSNWFTTTTYECGDDYHAEGDNVDCFTWNYGVVRDEDWHLCNETTNAEPPNLVFYYVDRVNESSFDHFSRRIIQK